MPRKNRRIREDEFQPVLTVRELFYPAAVTDEDDARLVRQ